jgi:hypothetical protein
VRAVELGNLVRASELTDAYSYQLFQYTDRGDHNAVDFLLEEKNPIRRGWGLYVFRREAVNNLIIEAPHPVADANTPRVALDLYRALNARALLVAGAHRDANADGLADVAHAPGTIFQTVHNTLTGSTQAAPDAVIVLQIHGFDSSKHSGYPDIVIGYDRQAPEAMIVRVLAMKEVLTDGGLSVGLCDGKSWLDLCGTKDILASVPDGFTIHIEMDEAVRSHDRVLVDALTRVFADLSTNPAK